MALGFNQKYLSISEATALEAYRDPSSRPLWFSENVAPAVSVIVSAAELLAGLITLMSTCIRGDLTGTAGYQLPSLNSTEPRLAGGWRVQLSSDSNIRMGASFSS